MKSEAHRRKMRERAERREERSRRRQLTAPPVEPNTGAHHITTDVNRTKAAALKRERRRIRNLTQVARGGWPNACLTRRHERRISTRVR